MTDDDEVSDCEKILDENDQVARDLEFGIIHDTDGNHGQDHPTVRTDYLDPEECWACRRCWGYPGTKDQLDAVLGQSPVSTQSDGQESLARWSA